MTTLIEDVDLSLMPGIFLKQGKEYWANGDILNFMALLPDDSGLDFVYSNIAPLKSRGLYELAFLSGFTGCKTNLSSFSENFLSFLLVQTDKKKLLASGMPLPSNGPFLLYRGVAGVGAKRRLRGISWPSVPI